MECQDKLVTTSVVFQYIFQTFNKWFNKYCCAYWFIFLHFPKICLFFYICTYTCKCVPNTLHEVPCRRKSNDQERLILHKTAYMNRLNFKNWRRRRQQNAEFRHTYIVGTIIYHSPFPTPPPVSHLRCPLPSDKEDTTIILANSFYFADILYSICWSFSTQNNKDILTVKIYIIYSRLQRL